MAITKRQIDALKYDPNGPETQIPLWDSRVPGLGVRVFASGIRSFVLAYRTEGGRKRRITLGTYGAMTLDQARDKARDELHAVRTGTDPAERKRQARLDELRGVTWREFLPKYIENARTRGNPGRRSRKPKRTWRDDELRAERHIMPAWGRRKLDDITRADVRRLHASIAAKYEANRVLALVSVMFRTAVDLGYLPEDHENPARGVTPNAEQSRDRFVTEAEMPKLAKAINAEPNPHLRRAFWLYLLLGVRRSELCALKWSDVDLEARRARLGWTKNGKPHYLPLGPTATQLLAEMPRLLGNDYVLASPKRAGQPWNVDQVTRRWQYARKRAGLEDVRLHDLRRTVGSWMASSGEPLNMIGAILNNPTAVGVYARYQDDAPRRAIEDHDARIAAFTQNGGAA